MDPNKPERESFDEFVRRMCTGQNAGQRGTPFNPEYGVPPNQVGKNLYEMIKRIQQTPIEPITFNLSRPGPDWSLTPPHINCKCNLQPSMSIEDQLQRELAFDEARLILRKMVGYDVGMN